jgi:hypothetical protein
MGARLTVIVDQALNVPHDLAVASVGLGGGGGERGRVGGGGLRVQHERDGQQAFDEFD